MQNRNKVARSYRLSPTAVDLIEHLTEKLGLSQAGTLELAVRRLAEQEGVKVSTATKGEEPTDGE